MREEKNLIQLVRRYETTPFSRHERIALSVLAAFFVAMSLLFFLKAGG